MIFLHSLPRAFSVIAVSALIAVGAVAQVKVDSRLTEYSAVQGVSGSIKSVGSDTMNNFMTLWAEKFKERYPNVQVEIEGKGSSTAPPAPIEGAANFAPMSRVMKQWELDAFEKRFGYKPTSFLTAIDILAVYVHKDNPVSGRGLSLQEVDAIFSSTLKGGHSEDITTGGQLGLTGEWASAPISLYGRNSASGTYGYLKTHARFVLRCPGCGQRQFRHRLQRNRLPHPRHRRPSLAVKTGGQPVPATPETVSDYPLARFLQFYINHKPGTELDPLRREFLMQRACRTSNFTAFMYLGRLIEYGNTGDLFTNPRLRAIEDHMTGRFG